ncbi:MAG: sugar phosphate isomerase/epimerase family protein [Roseiflexaceae bacterium]|nr:sugar phosphate isomerase/epimerase family protein [Roseiflexaceae bacterium]
MDRTDKTPPSIGAALPIRLLPTYSEWLIEGQRDLEIQDGYSPDVLDSDWRTLVAQARSALNGHTGRVGIHGPFLGMTIMANDRKLRGAVSERLCQGVSFAAALGATHMVMHSPFIFFGSPFLPHTPASGLYDQIKVVQETVGPALELATQAGCTLVIENIQDTNPAPLLALIRSFNSQYVRMSLDTGHASITHRIGGPPPDQWVREAGALLEHVHVQDNDSNLDRHWTPGDGHINWFGLFEAISTLEHHPRLLLELRDPLQIQRAADYLVNRGLAI